jgi:hypothetical protein
VDPLFIPYPVLSNYSVQSMSFFFKLFFSAAISSNLSSNLSALLKFVSPGRRYLKLMDSPKVFGPTVRPAVQSYFIRFAQQLKLFFSQRLKKRFFGRRRHKRNSFRVPSRAFLVSKNRIPRFNSHWHHFKRLTSPEFRIFVGIRFSHFLKNPLFFWSYAGNTFRGYNPHISYDGVEDLRLFISPNRLKVLYTLYERLRPLFFLVTIMSYALQTTRRPLHRSFFFKGPIYTSFYAMLLHGSQPSPFSRPLPKLFPRAEEVGARPTPAGSSKDSQSNLPRPVRSMRQPQPTRFSPLSTSRKILV